MYALSVSAEGDYYLCVPPDPGIEAAALGASESVLPGTTPAEALHTFTLDSGASRCFFGDSTTLTPLSAPVPVRLADPSRGPVLARSSTVLPCSMVSLGSLSGIHLPSFSTNLVSTAALQDTTVTTTTPGGQRVLICTCTRMGHHLATFTRRPGSSLYTLAIEPPQIAASAQVSASDQVAPPCSCHLLSHQTLLWHHRLGHPSLPRLRGMHSRLLVFGLPRSLPHLPPSPAPPCLPCVEGRQRAAPHSSSFPPTTAPLQTLHMDVWGPARVSVRLQLREQFRQNLPVLRLHSDRGGEFSSDLLREFCHGEGILQPFTLPESPQQNGIAECRIGLVMEVARTSMIHAAAPHFLWPFALRCASAQPLPPCLLAGDLAYLALDGEGWRCVGVPDPLPGTARVEVAVGSGAARGAASGGAAFGGAEPGGAESEGAGFGGAEPAGVKPGGAEPKGVEPWGAESEGAESGGAEPRGTAFSRDSATGDPRAGGATAAGPGGARTRETEAAGIGGVGGVGAGYPTEPGASGARGAGAGGAGAGGAGAVGTGVGGAGAAGVPTPRSYAEAITGPYSSQWQAALVAEVASWKSTGTSVDAVPPPRANTVDGMWIFRVKRPPGSLPAFKARYVARGFSHRAFLQGSLHEEIWLRRPPGFTGSFPAGTQWSLRRPVHSLRQAPHEWHDTVRTTLAALGFTPSTAGPLLILRTDTSLPPFYILVYVDDLVFATADTEALTLVKSALQKRHTCTDLGELRSYLGLQITRDRARRTITLSQSHMVH
ncbi:unnamed protein product [Closterium sp. NIES-54]